MDGSIDMVNDRVAGKTPLYIIYHFCKIDGSLFVCGLLTERPNGVFEIILFIEYAPF